MFLTRIFIRQIHLELGDTYQVTRVITQDMIDKFVALIGDQNPIHGATQPSDSPRDHRVPGALLNGLVSGLIGTHFPGANSLVVGQEYSFPNKCLVDEEVQFRLELVQKRKIMKIAYECKQNDQVVLTGFAKIVNRRN